MQQQKQSEEHGRRVRILRRVVPIVTAGQLAAVGAYFAGWFPPAIRGMSVFIGFMAGGAVIAATGLWVIAAYRAPELSPREASELEERKRRFVRRFGVYRVGLASGVAVAVWTSWKDFHAGPAWVVISKTAPVFVVWIAAGLLSGRAWGETMWRALSPSSRPASTPPGDA